MWPAPRLVVFRAGFVGGFFAEQHQNVEDDEENAGEPFRTALDHIHRRAAPVAHKHCAQANGEKDDGENQTNVL